MRIFAFVIALLIPLAAVAQAPDPGAYLYADFTRNDYIPRDSIVADWNFLDAMVEGDLLNGQGDMETGAAGGGCTYCPNGLTCLCLGTSTLTQETSKVYKNNSSLKFVVDVAGDYIGYYYILVAEPNTAYQISFSHKGESGGENDYVQLVNAGLFYNFAIDAWQVPNSSVSYNLVTSWTKENLYFLNDAVPRNVVISLARAAGNQTFYIDDFQIRKLKNTGPKSTAGQYTLAPTVTSDMRFGDSPKLLSKPADGPAGWWGTWFDGVDDEMSIAGFNPTGDFTQCISVIQDNCPALARPVWKYSGAPNSGWGIYSATCTWNGLIGNAAGNSATGATNGTQNVLDKVCFRYDAVADGSSLLYIRSNNTVDTGITTARYPVDANVDTYRIMNGGGPQAGSMQNASYFSKYLDNIEVSKWINPHFPSNNNNRGSYVMSCSQAASHATCSTQKCRDGTPAACQAEGTGAMAIYGQRTELVGYNSYETVVNDDSNPLFTGHSTLSVNGDGVSSVTAYRDETMHGNVSVRLKSSGSTAYSAVSTVCIAVAPATTYYAYVSAKQLGGTRTNMFLRLVEYSDGACVTSVSQTDLITGSIDSSFSVRKPVAALTTTGATNSVLLAVVNFGAYAAATPTFAGTASSDILVDSISLKVAPYWTPWVHTPGAGTVTYNSRDYRIRNTIADQSYSGTYPYNTGWCASFWVYTDWAGNDGVQHYISSVAGTAGNNNAWYIYKWSNDTIYFDLFSSAGAQGYRLVATDATNWAAGNWKYFEGCNSNTGTYFAHWFNVANNTWYTLTNNVGGMAGQDGQTTSIYLGESGANTMFLDGFISQLCIKPYSATYTYCGFNSGKPPSLSSRPY